MKITKKAKEVFLAVIMVIVFSITLVVIALSMLAGNSSALGSFLGIMFTIYTINEIKKLTKILNRP